MVTVDSVNAKIGADVSGFKSGMAAMTGSMRGVSGMFKSLMAVGTAFAGTSFFGKAISEAQEFEDNLRQAAAQANLTEGQIDKIRKSASDMAIETTKGTDKIIDGFKFALSAGADFGEAQKLVNSAAKASASGFGNLTNLLRANTTVMQAWGESAGNSTERMDKIIAAAQQMEVEVPKLSGAMQRNISVASELGVSFNEMLAAIGSVSEQFGDANRGGRLLATSMSRLLNPSGGAKKAFEKIGTSTEELQENIREDGLTATMVELKEELDNAGLGLENVFKASQQLQTMLALTAKDGQRVDEIMEKSADSAGKTAQAFQKSESSARKQRRLFMRFEEIMRRIGTKSLPFVNDALKVLETVMFKRTEGMNDAIGIVAQAGENFMISWRAVRRFIMQSGAIDNFKQSWQGIKNFLPKVSDGIVQAGKSFMGSWRVIRNFLEESGVIDTFKQSWQSIKEFIPKAVSSIIGSVNDGLLSFLKGDFETSINTAEELIISSWRSINKAASDLIQQIRSTVDSMIPESVQQVAIQTKKNFMKSFRAIADSVQQVAMQTKKNFMISFRAIKDFAVNDVFPAIGDAAEGLWDALETGSEFVSNTFGPVIEEVFERLSDLIPDLIENKIIKAIENFRDSWNFIQGSITKLVKSGLLKFTSFGSGGGTGIEGFKPTEINQAPNPPAFPQRGQKKLKTEQNNSINVRNEINVDARNTANQQAGDALANRIARRTRQEQVTATEQAITRALMQPL